MPSVTSFTFMAVFFRKQFRKQAMVLGIELLDKHESHAGIWRQVGDQLGKSFDAARGSSNGGNKKVIAGFFDVLNFHPIFGGATVILAGVLLYAHWRTSPLSRI